MDNSIDKLMSVEKFYREYVEDSKDGVLPHFRSVLDMALDRLVEHNDAAWSLSMYQIDDDSPVKAISIYIESEVDIREVY